MKYILFFISFIVLVAGCSLIAETRSLSEAEGRVVAASGVSAPLNVHNVPVVIAGYNADTGLVAAVSAYVEKEYGEIVISNKLSVISSEKGEAKKLKGLVAELTLNTNDLVVILAAAGKDDKPLSFVTVVDPKKKLALINVDFLKTGIDDATVGNNKFLWRVEREAMKSVGLLMGLMPCFNPHCVLSNHVGLDGLDKKGRNLCPPCRMKLSK
jgi:hypothetical protein